VLKREEDERSVIGRIQIVVITSYFEESWRLNKKEDVDIVVVVVMIQSLQSC
jgi:hypothetical protein